MNKFGLRHYAYSITAATALFAGCGGSEGPIGAPGATGLQGASAARSGPLRPLRLNGVLITAMRIGTGERPNHAILAKKKTRGPYQYVTTFYGTEGAALQYDYPTGTSPIGVIPGLSDPAGECSTGKKTFWIVESGDDEIAEFAYGGTTPIATLSESTGAPASCAVDPKTGDVAVTVFGPPGGIVIFKGGKGHGKVVSGVSSSYFVGYDNQSDLFVDGFTKSATVGMIELAAGSKTFKSVTLPNTVEFPGSVQWDGKYLTLEDQEASDIYRYTVTNYIATLEGTVDLSGASDCAATWIAKELVFCGDAGNEDVEVYKYPAGGSPSGILTGADLPLSVVQVTK